MGNPYNKIGFLVGPGGNADHIGDYVRICDSAGVPAFIAANDMTTGISDVLDLWQQGSTVPHNLLFRVVKGGGEHYAIPDYSLSPKDAALEYFDRIEPEINPVIKLNRDKIWIALGNELDKERCDWLGNWGYESSILWNAHGYKVALFGFASGTPEPAGWLTPGMIEFLRLASEHPLRIAVNLHEYSYDIDNILDIFPWKIGRFQFLFDVCDGLNINRPTVLMGEWGWVLDNVPSVDNGMLDVADVANLYAQFKTILGASAWTLQTWWSSIYNKLNKYVLPMADFSASYKMGSFSMQDKVFIAPDWEEEDNVQEMTFGIDVSRYQGNMDWAKAKSAGVNFAFIKLTEGTAATNRIKDVQFDRNWAGSKQAGIYRGAYHFYNAWLDPIAQADWFADNMPSDWDLPPVADVEDRRGASATENVDVRKFLLRVEERLGVKPIVYTAPGYWNSVVGYQSWAKDYDLWVAHWLVSSPQLPLGWNTWKFWQYDVIYGGGELGSQSDRLDVDNFNGSRIDLEEYVAQFKDPEPPSTECFEINPFTRTFLLYPKNQSPEQQDFIDNAMTVGVEVDGEIRSVGVSGWSTVDGFKDIREAIEAGKTNSRLLILDGESIGTGLNLAWLRANCPLMIPYTRWYESSSAPPPPPPPPPPPVEKIDLAGYIIGDGRRYYLKNHNGSTQEILQSQVGTDRSYQVKNTAWESFLIDEQWIRRDKDTSPGGGRYYTQREGDLPARWLPRFMSVGESFTVPLDVQFYNLSNCSKSAPNSGNVIDTRKLVKHYPKWTSRHGIPVDDVVEVQWINGGETYFYGNKYGLVGWERTHQDPNSPQWTAISELVDGGNNTRMSGCYS
jgi:GH25 family lysozyme M1 (1,4-beta-N-acetylmuramidase)